MSSYARSISLAFVSMVSVASAGGCGGSPGEPAPDAPVSTVPVSAAGRFDVTSTFDVPVPAVAAPVIVTLTSATDGPDDPSRYLLDRMIATLPEGTIKTIAGQASPYVAAYLNARIATIAPRLVSGIDELAAGLDRIATHLATTETLVIDDTGAATRTITGVRFDLGDHVTSVRLADAGLADIVVHTQATLEAGGRLTLADHTHALPYGAWLRLGLDLAVIPRVEPTAHDLASVLATLIDCPQLGANIASQVGLGTAVLYATACQAAVTVLASDLYTELAALDQAAMALEVTGTASGVDRDGDGTMDDIHAGGWTGALHEAGATDPISTASFTGAKSP